MDWLDRWLVEGVCTHPDLYHSSYLLPVNRQKEIVDVENVDSNLPNIMLYAKCVEISFP